ncbi:SurA N-terminal domain-containing protein [Fodinibius saliphilus]|uniref:SurA N-terminal domain-containing protein n=1 Tax=Fodinibius saliphilus TaxID=1920650 RepID=UPI001107C881|nr:SurA N-terminal domain-containing protein [Fodinibius saliphilus]
MGVMEKMRKGTGVILWVLIFSFGILWMLQDTDFFSVLQRGPRSLGAVNGETISLEEYNNRMQYYTRQYNQQSGNSMTPEVRAQYQEQVWNELVTGKLIQQKMDALGIKVTDQEVVDMITGPNPDPFIRKQFAREDGTIDRVALQNAIESPENKQVWIQIEQQMRQKRRQQKMTNYLQSSMEVSDYEVEQEYIRRNTSTDISFVRFPYAEATESEVAVTEDEMREYYNSNSDKYKRKESYRFKYISFDKKPTAQDTARTIRDMKQLKSDFAKAENDSLFLNRYQSTTEYSAELVPKEDVRELFRPVIQVDEGGVTDLIKDGGRLYLLKKLEETSDEVRFVVFSQDITADPIATIDKRAEKADDFSFFAEQEGFETEVERRSLNVKEAFATKGNNFISGIGQSRQIMNFLENAEEGDISNTIELAGQFVVLKVSEITPPGTRPFEEVKNQIQTLVENNKRKQVMLDRADKLASENESMSALAEAAGKELATAQSLTQDASTIPGAGREPRVIGMVFGLEEGERSSAIEGKSAAFIVKIDKLREADVSNLTSSARQQIRRQLQREKSSAFMSTWIEQLKEEADIEDNRAQVLRG